MKKGQVTIFIIIGILAIASFSMVQRVKQEAIEQQLTQDIEEVTDNLFETTTIQRYVEICLDELSRKALYFVQHQGGVIYPYQGTSLYEANPRFIDFKLGSNYSSNITYGIVNDRSYYGVDSPRYPCSHKYGEAPTFCGFIDNVSIFPLLERRKNRIMFGVDNLNPLCRTDKDCQYFYGTKSGFNSIQEQIETYIKKNMNTCVNFTNFFEVLNQNVTIDNEPEVKVQFKPRSMEIDLSYSLNLTSSQGFTSKLLEFQSLIQTDMMTMYSLAYEIILNEITNLSYSPLMIYDYPGISNYQYQFSHLRNYYMGDDIVRIINPNNYLLGKNEIFQFSIENRPPALDYIPSKFPSEEEYDIIIMENNSLVIKPFAKDPDDDQLIYYYHGWMGEYKTSYVDNDGKYHYPRIYVDGVSTNKNINQFSEGNVLDYSLFTPTELQKIKLEEDENFWHNSGFYEETKKIAYINLTREHIGPHNFTVFVMDQQNLFDYQTVRLLVDDQLNADASKSKSIFDDLNNRYPDKKFTSIEDPFILDASASEDQIRTGNIVYEWFDTYENPSLLIETENETIYFPDKMENLNIVNMKDYSFSNSSGSPNLHFLRLTAKSEGITGISESATNIIDLDVYECIPHRNDVVKIYPYNGNENPFLADHTCCIGQLEDMESNPDWGTYKDDKQECYREVVNIKANDVLSDSDLEKYCGSDKDNCIFDNNLESLSEDLEKRNDVTQLVAKRFCSDDRGNVCLGELNFSLEVTKNCGKIQNEWQTETCSGAEKQAGEMVCLDYSNFQSFEKKNGLKKLSYDGISLSETSENSNGYCSNRTWCVDGYGDEATLKNDGQYLVSPGCFGGKCQFVSEQNSFDCSLLDGYDLSDSNLLGIDPLSDIDVFLRGKEKSFESTCGTLNGNSYCQKNVDDNLEDSYELILETDYETWDDERKVSENFAIIESEVEQYDSSGSSQIWSQNVCGDDSGEHVRKYERQRSDLSALSAFNYALVTDYNIDSGLSTIGCCKNSNDCVYEKDDGEIVCYESTNNFDFLGDTSFSNSNNHDYGFKKNDNLHLICKDGKWLYLEPK